MKTTLRYIILAMVAALAAGSFSCKKKEAAAPEGPMTVNVAVPEVDSVMLRKSFPGYITANNEVNLVARVDGVLIARPYKPGELVKKGTVLFRIDDTTYRNDVEQAQASLDNARASYEYSSKQYEAMRIALESDAVSQMEVLQAKSSMDEAAAQIRNYEAALETARTTLGYCTVRAPFDGRVSLSKYDPGNYLAGAASPVVLANIYDDATVYANIEIDNDTYMDIVNNAAENLDLSKIPVSFNEELPHAYTANLTYMAPDIDKTTGTMLLQATIDNPYGELKSGMFVTVDIPFAHLDKAILIEDAAIGTDQLGKYIYVVNDSNQIVYTPVEVGQVVNSTKRVITKGIEPGTRYVTKALLKVRDGEKVNPVTPSDKK